jgi:putative tricarboxylic transport membrane protein
VVVALFLKAAGIKANYVPFDSAGKMHAQVLGGHIDARFEEFGSTISLLGTGDLKALGFSKKNQAKIPDSPVCRLLTNWVGMWRWGQR